MSVTKINGATQIQADSVTSAELAAWSENRDGGGFQLTNIADPTLDTDAATQGWVNDQIAGVSGSFKTPVIAATTADFGANIAYDSGTKTITHNAGGTFTLDGISFTGGIGERVLVKNQTDAKMNGIYTVTDIGGEVLPWSLTRATDCDASAEFVDALVCVQQGTANANTAWGQTADTGFTMDTDDNNWVPLTKPGLSMHREAFAGTGAEDEFTLAASPVPAGTELVYLNGVLQTPGGGNDYTISAAVITFASNPEDGAVITVVYWT